MLKMKVLRKVLDIHFLAECKDDRIPPIFSSDDFVTCCKEKTTLFDDYFASQCTSFLTDSMFPHLTYLTNN